MLRIAASRSRALVAAAEATPGTASTVEVISSRPTSIVAELKL